jgi:lysosomal acid lipase/cholesteryl ester hydrolase
MLHGLDGSSKSLIISGSNAIPYQLADTGKYDIWLLNSRGNHFSRKHLWLDPDTQREFWDFSFQEMAEFDLKATV